MNYWTCTFDYGTWQARDPGFASWEVKRRSLIGRVEPGDTVVCYIAKVGWVGLLRVVEPARHDPDASPFGEDYPIVAPVETILTLSPEQAMPARALPRPHGTLRQGDHGEGAPMPYLFQGSGINLADEVGDSLANLLASWRDDPPEPVALKSSQIGYSAKPEIGVTEEGTQVSIPDDDDPALDASVDDAEVTEVTDHSATQRKLLELGRVLGFTPWLTSDDQSRAAHEDGTALGDLAGVTTNLPRQFDDTTNRTIRHIDVMWLDKAAIRAAFEVENSTSIYSGILRMADLLALQPNLDIPLYIVVPDERLEKALGEIKRPVFQSMQKRLSSMCRALTYSAVDELVDLAKAAGGHLSVGVLNTKAESAVEAT